MSKAKELPIPSRAEADPNARELVRVWAAMGSQHVALATNVWRDPAAWGIMLADLAQHIVNAHCQTDDERSAFLVRLKSGFDAEWKTPTDVPKKVD